MPSGWLEQVFSSLMTQVVGGQSCGVMKGSLWVVEAPCLKVESQRAELWMLRLHHP
jgi:hypothetical protein